MKFKTHHQLLKRFVFIIMVFLFFFCIATASVEGKKKKIVGWVEYVWIYPGKMKIKAKLDTGAKHSSLHTDNAVEIKHGKDAFVKFSLTDWQGHTQTFESKIIRMAKIKQHNSEPELRPVILIGICLNNIYKDVEVNLVNRSNFNYRLLIGRSFFKGDFAIDPAKTFTVQTDCQKVLPHE